MELAKALMVRHIISDACIKEDDVLTLGYAAKESLLSQRKVISVVCTNEQLLHIEATCMATIETSHALKKWAGLIHEDKEMVATEEDNEDTNEEDDGSELDAGVDNLLHGLSRPG